MEDRLFAEERCLSGQTDARFRIVDNDIQTSDSNYQQVCLEIDAAAKITFASAQNFVPILRRVAVRNDSPGPLENLRLTLTVQPTFCRSKEWIIDRIPAGETLALSDLRVSLDFGTLDRLDEAERGELVFQLFRESELLAEQPVEIELLARDEWGGSSEMAQMLAAFVSPNHVQTARILKDASRLLEANGETGSLDGYQSGDPRRVYMLAGAVWSAVTGLGLSYAEPPKSFESQGQKVRDPGNIVQNGLATCLDLSLLLAAALEQAGLNPAVIFTEGHAFAGVWLCNKTFARTVESDVTDVRKAVASHEFVPFEATLLTKRPSVDFAYAADNAIMGQLREEREAEFLWVIDIARARSAGIKPLSSRQTADSEAPQPQDQVAAAPLPETPSLDWLPPETVEETPQTPQGRIERWQKKLLDLSLRNRLLNFSETKQTLRFVCSDVPALEDALADGRRFRIISLIDENPVGERDPDSYRRQTGRDIDGNFAKSAFEKRELCTPVAGKDMKGRLTTLYRKAQADLAEGGTNTLFMAVGFLRWKKSETDTRSYRAPLLLMPVKLSRRSAQSDYYLSHHEDDVRFNQTLLQLLEQDFGLQVPQLRGELPRDQAGLDVPRILQTMRQAVRDVPGFEVTEDIALSVFSFAKFLMWKDLVDRTDGLRNNRLVRHLIDNPTEAFQTGGGSSMPQPSEVDRRVAPKNLFMPLPADSSQLAAVVAAAAGNDFVMIGPPGTGKSQTITNMIAHCLANGRTVLFVAEKAAALNVVHRRLKACGLADVCLELHSNKTERKSVINQLGQAWDRIAEDRSQEWVSLTSDLEVRRDELNHYVAALHHAGSHGFSIFDAIGRVAGETVTFDLSFASHDSHDRDSYRDLENLAERAGLAFSAVAECQVWAWVNHTEWSHGWQIKLIKRIDSLDTATHALAEACHALGEVLDLEAEADVSEARQSMLLRLAKAIERITHDDFRVVLDSRFDEMTAGLDGFEAAIDTYRSERSRLRATYEDSEIVRVPLEEIDHEWRRASARLWPFSVFGRRRVRKWLQSYASAGRVDPATELAPLKAIQGEIAQIETSLLAKLPDFNGTQSEPRPLRAYLSDAADIRATFYEMKRQSEKAGERLAQAIDKGESTEVAQKAAVFLAAKDEFGKSMAACRTVAEGEIEVPSLKYLGSVLADMKSKTGRLQDWLKWTMVRKEATARGLGPLIEALQNGTVSDAKSAFRVAYFQWWLSDAIDASPCLRNFVHWEQEDRIQRFRETVEAIQQLAATQVRLKVAHGLPAKDGVPTNSELGFLRHQLGLKSPRTSIRQLLERMRETFTQLTPCVLMSPLSVAQYLPADQALFDMAIFDEASQITTWDAIGTIARGRQSVIVGDPMQLPPTNFFGRTDSDGDDDGLAFYEQELPSILDEARNALPERQLNWHYRSRDEALIAFSNHHYYKDQLVTFPSPRTQSNAVRFHLVQGIYARGSGRTNEVEAKAVVQLAVERLKLWLNRKEAERPTLGIITFNVQQQELILDLLDAERRKTPALEWFFDADREEPAIVKNLESIQGDERDVMLFSITFGPDKAGKLPMTFGAINLDGGQKRLNVAVTRAREELHVFSSITSDKIDTTRAKGLGVAHLKNFLDYAQRGAVALPAMNAGSLGPAESPFEESMADALRGKGWEVRTQIGVSGFRIDLGVVHPDKAGAYLAGVECDGATYHRSATARDRDQIREAVLRNLGWKILRIWSTDWFTRGSDALERVHGQLGELLERDRAEREKAVCDRITEEASYGLEPSASPIEEGEPQFSAVPDAPLPDDLQLNEKSPANPLGKSWETERFSGAVIDRSENSASSANTFGDGGSDAGVASDLELDKFFDLSYVPTLEGLVSEIVAMDGPLRDIQLVRKIARQHGWQRAGRRIRERVLNCLGNNERHEENGNVFIWKPGSHAAVLPFRSDLKRTPRDIPQAEIFGLIKAHPGLRASEDPARDLARLMDLSRLTDDSRSYLGDCLLKYRELHQDIP